MGMARSILYSLNFFATPQRANAVLFSLRLTPALILITVISGIVPSIALPYFRRFKVTGINAGPFHSSLLTAVVGSVVGVSIVLSFLGIFYKILWAGGAPTSYHYALIVLVGLSLHYAAGTYIGRDKAESIVLQKLVDGKYDRKRILVLDQNLNRNAKDIQLQLVIQDRWET
jgi:ABC-type amino acid transport system permease subunit